MSTQPAGGPTLQPLLARWVAAGIITDDQAERIRADVAQSGGDLALATGPGVAPEPGPTDRAPSLVIEALGYLGGVIVLVGLGLVVSRLWDGMTTAERVALPSVVAVLLTGAGIAVPARLGSPGARLRSVLWAAAAVATFAAIGLYTSDLAEWTGSRVLLVASIGTGLVGAAMWLWHQHVLQHVVCFWSLILAVGAGFDLAAAYPAPTVAIWLAAAAWVLLSLVGVLPPRRTGLVLGSIVIIISSLILESRSWGPLLALAAVVGLIGIAVIIRDLALLGVSSVGTLVVLPVLVTRYFPGVLSAALTLVVVGLALVAIAVYTTRRRHAASRASATV